MPAGPDRLEHARPLLAETVPAAVAAAIKDPKQAIGQLVRGRPAAARRALDDVGEWTRVVRQRFDYLNGPLPKVGRMQAQLEALGESASGRTIGR